jgi:superfamily I DNA and/or RNA helicase
VKLLPFAKILVTTNSNSACDEIGDRLLNYIGPNRVYRFYSPSLIRRLNRVSSDLVPYSNLKSGEHKQPSLEEILSYNVVISTLVNSGRLSFTPSQHFDFIFIDECASVSEAYVNIPIALAVNKNRDFKASIVLLGDPKQLGQITKTFHTER